MGNSPVLQVFTRITTTMYPHVLSLTSSTITSRVPVFEERIDNIVGIVYAMDMLEYVEEVHLSATTSSYKLVRLILL